MNTDENRYDGITEIIIGCAFRVSNKLGCGFLEKVYENALVYELRKAGLRVEQQVPLKVWYEEIIVGEYVADLIVEDVIILELKAQEQMASAYVAVCINYLAATRMPLCLLINFGKRVEVKRVAGTSLSQSPS